MFRTLLVKFNRIMTPKEKDWFFFQKEGKIFFTIEDPQYFQRDFSVVIKIGRRNMHSSCLNIFPFIHFFSHSLDLVFYFIYRAVPREPNSCQQQSKRKDALELGRAALVLYMKKRDKKFQIIF